MKKSSSCVAVRLKHRVSVQGAPTPIFSEENPQRIAIFNQQQEFFARNKEILEVRRPVRPTVMRQTAGRRSVVG
ncbi:hypothetical protein [Streptomyces sp. NPDC090798]|uniref:hypothetical protein n=1 Tax=Streptomyces sp. NPDC090798 TaxID=3365968 RepID=UPI003815D07C